MWAEDLIRRRKIMALFRAVTDLRGPLTDRARTKTYVVVHPLDDTPEKKVETSGLGLIRMTRSVRISLIALRAYLIAMMLLLLYHVLTIAGLFGNHAH